MLTYGLSNYISLPRHDYTCVLTCCQIADVDFDGEQEILIGNSSEVNWFIFVVVSLTWL